MSDDGIADLARAAHGGALLAQVALRHEVHRMLRSGDSARSEIDRFLREGSPRDWIAFDASMRAFWYGEDRAPKHQWWRRAWSALRPSDVEESDVLALGLASMDRDGRVREAAVRRLATEPDSLVGPFLRCGRRTGLSRWRRSPRACWPTASRATRQR